MDSPVYVFGSTTLRKKFPEIADIEVQITDIFPGIKERRTQTRTYSGVDNVPSRHPCVNEKCRDGGVDINQILTEMVRERQTEYKKSRMCHGRISSPKGRKDYGGCHHDFDVTIKIVYSE